MVVNPLAPVIRAGLLPVLREHFDVVEIDASVADAARSSTLEPAVAIVGARDDVAILDAAPVSSLVIGISSASYDVLILERASLAQASRTRRLSVYASL